MQNVKSTLNLVAALLFGALFTIGEGKHDKLFLAFGLGLLALGIWLIRSNLPWWHNSSVLASFATGRLFANAWLIAHGLRAGSVLDGTVWSFLAIGLFLFLSELMKLRSQHPSKPMQGPR